MEECQEKHADANLWSSSRTQHPRLRFGKTKSPPVWVRRSYSTGGRRACVSRTRKPQYSSGHKAKWQREREALWWRDAAKGRGRAPAAPGGSGRGRRAGCSDGRRESCSGSTAASTEAGIPAYPPSLPGPGSWRSLLRTPCPPVKPRARNLSQWRTGL